MKTILFITPIFIITNNLYKLNFGNYDVYYEWNKCLQFCLTWRAMFSMLVFIGIFFFAYTMEKIIIPSFFLFYEGKIDILDFRKTKIIMNKILKKRLGFNVWLYLDNELKRELYPKIIFVPIVFILWLISINSIISYSSIICVVILTIYFFKLINTFVYEYRGSKQ